MSPFVSPEMTWTRSILGLLQCLKIIRLIHVASHMWRCTCIYSDHDFLFSNSKILPSRYMALKKLNPHRHNEQSCATSIQEHSLGPHIGLHYIHKRASEVTALSLLGHTKPLTILIQISSITYTEEYPRLGLSMSSISQQIFIKHIGLLCQ